MILRSINPAVQQAAELMTDGRITDALLADVARMHALPLHVTVAAPAAPSAAEVARATLDRATAEHCATVSLFDVARKLLGQDSRRTLPPVYRGGPIRTVNAATSRRLRGLAMRQLNAARRAMFAAADAVAAARAAFAAVAS